MLRRIQSFLGDVAVVENRQLEPSKPFKRPLSPRPNKHFGYLGGIWDELMFSNLLATEFLDTKRNEPTNV